MLPFKVCHGQWKFLSLSDKARSALTYDGMEHVSEDDEHQTRSKVMEAYVEHMHGTILVREEKKGPNKIREVKGNFICVV